VQLLYAPQLALMVLSATAFSYYQHHPYTKAGIIHGIAWVAQFLGHGFAEKRAPTLLDNLLGGGSCSNYFSV
jgi:2-hydroxy fatty acid dioxygenase